MIGLSGLFQFLWKPIPAHKFYLVDNSFSFIVQGKRVSELHQLFSVSLGYWFHINGSTLLCRFCIRKAITSPSFCYVSPLCVVIGVPLHTSLYLQPFLLRDRPTKLAFQSLAALKVPNHYLCALLFIDAMRSRN